MDRAKGYGCEKALVMRMSKMKALSILSYTS